jgi:hypothetical protein
VDTGTVKAIGDIRKGRDSILGDEASIRSGAVMRLLASLGWDPFDVGQVKPEFAAGRRRVDFALLVDGKPRVFVEVEPQEADLERRQQQLLTLASRSQVRLVVLTNGAKWVLYLAVPEGGDDLRFCAVDLLQDEPKEAATGLQRFLSREAVASDEAVSDAEEVCRGIRRKKALRVDVPKAWEAILSDPPDLLLVLVAEVTERLSGFRPEKQDVAEFLTGLGPDSKPKGLAETPSVAPLPEVSRPRTETFSGKRIIGFVLFGQSYRPGAWQDLLTTVTRELYARHRASFRMCLSLGNGRATYFSTDPRELRSAAKVGDSPYHVEVRLEPDAIVRLCRELMGLFGHRENDLRVEAR